ncbi:MAG TPA: hypothetical protein VFB21_10865 [Chthonomonadaceae bacterium]|nr:hypothetical protein [Chthonomonadaceae bacterium]
MTSLSDREILRRVQRGERNLYMELFDRYYDRVERYARSQSNEDASGLASDTFQWAYRSVESFRFGEMSYLAYLLTLCRKLVWLERNRRSSTPPCAGKEDAASVPACRDAASVPCAGGQEAPQQSFVRDAWWDLSAEDREILYLVYESALSRQEVMGILGEPSPDAFAARLYRAMQRLDAVARQPGR